ncbi:MAG: ABC transporter permease [Clostridia bacterium]|nr:ABC transporter permease [Clostridia bacterium]
MKKLGRFYAGLMYLLLYAPILVMVLYSFNAKKSTSTLSFSYGAEKYTFGHWYREVFASGGALIPLRNSLILALLTAFISMVMGTLAAYALYKLRLKYVKRVITSVTNIPMMNPDIVTGLSMMLLFATTFYVMGAGGTGFATLLIAHVTFCLPYVILSIMPRLRQMDKNLPEAAMDLGCTPIQSFFMVQLPFLAPAVLSGFVMAFTLSLDDYVVSLFTSGPSFETLPIYVYNMARRSVPPSIYAISTLFLVLVLGLLILSNTMQSRLEKKISSHSERTQKNQ